MKLLCGRYFPQENALGQHVFVAIVPGCTGVVLNVKSRPALKGMRSVSKNRGPTLLKWTCRGRLAMDETESVHQTFAERCVADRLTEVTPGIARAFGASPETAR